MRGAGVLALLLAACGSSAVPRSPTPTGAAAQDGKDAATALADGADASADGDAAAVASDAREDRRIAKMMKRVAEARHLSADRAVPGVVLARDALIARVKAHVDREVPPEAIRHEGLELQILGFVPSTFDYEAETFALLQAQLAGFYEPADGTMYMAADLQGESAEATLAHELDHALQDQHFDLKPHAKYEPGKSDEQSAFDGLAEGDATSTMADVLLTRASPGKTALDLPDEVFVEQVLESVSSGPAASAPHVMRTSLVAPYVNGTLFVNALRRSGGWAAVDAAWATLPTTSEQILHPEKWRAKEPALAVSAPTFAALGAGWSKVDEDSNGELGLRLAFEEWMGADKAKIAADGWGGDRAVLLENGDRTALAMRVRYDANRAERDPSKEPFALLASGWATSLGKPAAKDGAWVCEERASLGPIGAMKQGRDLVMVAGPAKTGATWEKAGDCALAKKWAKEIATAAIVAK